MTGTLPIHSLNVATEGSLTLYTCPMWQWMNCPEILRNWRARQSRVLPCIPQTTIDICSVLQMLRLCLALPFPRANLSRHLSK